MLTALGFLFQLFLKPEWGYYAQFVKNTAENDHQKGLTCCAIMFVALVCCHRHRQCSNCQTTDKYRCCCSGRTRAKPENILI